MRRAWRPVTSGIFWRCETEYAHYYGKPIEAARIENQFQQAADLTCGRDYPGAASMLEILSRDAPLPVVFTDLGVIYSTLGDAARRPTPFAKPWRAIRITASARVSAVQPIHSAQFRGALHARSGAE